MLVPQIINKPKFGVVDGKIVPTGTVEIQQFVKYNMSDFTEEGLRSLVQAGHEDYFDDSEKDELKELGILQKELDPQLKIVSCDNNYDYATCVISFLGNGTPSLTGPAYDISYNSSNKEFSFWLNNNGIQTITVSLTADPPYVAASVSYTWHTGIFPV